MENSDLQKLVEEIKAAKDAYYNLNPIISDEEYDAKLNLLKKVQPEHQEVKSVGAPVPSISVWEKVQHEIPMGSLNKANSVDEFMNWCSRVNKDDYFITHKIDGSSMELVYEEGDLKRCVTRGDGNIGEDVTENLYKCPSIPKNIKERDGKVIIRGEMVMLKSTFDELYKEEYANPRNTAAAKVREKKNGGKDCVNLKFIGYKVLSVSSPKTMIETMDWLKNHGFQVPSFYINGSINEMKLAYENTVEKRNQIEYEIDGMVISVNNIEELEDLGGGLYPEGQIAWKFESEKSQTTVCDVEWGVGLTGRITPVAIVEPVSIGGVEITSISLHNLKFFSELKLFKGCRVIVSRRNDVIPYIEKNLDLCED